MADQRLRAILEFLVKGDQKVERALKGVGDESRRVEAETSRSATGLSKMQSAMGGVAIAAGTVGAAIFTAKKAFDFGAEGAQILKIRDTFDALTESVGETSQTVLTQLRQATQGMVADTELMASANQFLSMGLAQTGAEAAELQRIAVTLGSAMGKDATQAMEEFSLLLANQSIPRLDTFGISAGKVRGRIAELQEANENMSRETAFMTAVMEEAEISMTRLGDQVPVDEFTEFQVASKNLTDALKITVAQGLTPVISGMNDFIFVATKSKDILAEQADELTSGVKSTREQEVAITQLADAYDIATDSVAGLLSGAGPQLRRELVEGIRLYAGTVDSLEEFEQGLENAGIAEAFLWQNTRLTNEQFFEQEGAIGRAERQSRVAERRFQALSDVQDDLFGSTKDTADASEDLADSIEITEEEMKDAIRASDDYGRSLSDAGDAMMGLSADSVSLADAMRSVAESAAASVGEVNDLVDSIDDLEDSEGGLATTQDELAEQFFDTARAMAGNADKVEELNRVNKSFNLTGKKATEMVLGLGVVLGELTEEQAAAIVESLRLQAAVEEVSEAFLSGAISAEEAKDALIGVAGGLYETAQEALEAERAARLVEDALADLEGAGIDIEVETRELREALTLVQELRAEVFLAQREMGRMASGAAGATSGGGGGGGGGGTTGGGGATGGGGTTSGGGTTGGGTTGGGGGGLGGSQVLEDAFFRVPPSGPPMTATFSPGDYVTATQAQPANGTNGMASVTVNIYPQTEMDIDRAIQRAFEKAGIKANMRRRTI